MLSYLALLFLVLSVAQSNPILLRVLGAVSNVLFIIAYWGDSVIVISNVIVMLLHTYYLLRMYLYKHPYRYTNPYV
jgi:hypothetical protein